MAPSTTKYSEIQHDEIEALRSIYMEEFQEESLKVGAWNGLPVDAVTPFEVHRLIIALSRQKTPDRAFSITLKPSADEYHALVLTLSVSLPATYPKTLPKLSLNFGEDIRPATRAAAAGVISAKPKALLGSEMIFEITTALQDIIDHAAHGKGENVPTLEEERANQQAAASRMAQKVQEEQQREQIQASIEEEQYLGEMVLLQKSREEKRREKPHAITTQEQDTGQIRDVIHFDRPAVLKDPWGNDVVADAIHGKILVQEGPVTKAWLVRHVGASEGSNFFLILKGCHVPARSDELTVKKHIQNLELKLEELTHLPSHSNIVRPLTFRISRSETSGMNQVQGWDINVLIEKAGRGSLHDVIEMLSPLDVAVGRAWAIQLLEGLGHYHRHGVTHGDIHCNNVLLDKVETGRVIAKLSDGGYQHQLHALQGHYQCGDHSGSASTSWRAPELLTGGAASPSPATDTWNLGIIILQMFFGLEVQGRFQSPTAFIDATDLSPSLDRLLRSIFQYESKKRPSAWELVSSSFLRNDDPLYQESVAESPASTRSQRHGSSHYRPGSSRFATDFVQAGKLGKGGYGSVVKARNRLDSNFYAVKIINKCTEAALDKVLNEVRLLSQLNHPNVVRYYTAWKELENPATTGIHDDLSDHEETEGSSEGEASGSVYPTTSGGLDFIASHNQYSDDELTSSDSDRDAFNDDSDGIIFGGEDDDEAIENSLSSSTGIGDGVPGIRRQSSSHVDVINNTLYIQMEYCEKQTLRDVIKSGVQSNADEAWRYLRQILHGLSHIHGASIVHRDLKPENVFIDSNSNVRIGDFGLARPGEFLQVSGKGASITKDFKGHNGNFTRSIGTTFYVAPEVKSSSTARGNYDEKADMFSLGVIFFEMNYRLETGMERVHTLGALCKSDSSLPVPFSKDPEKAKQAQIILSLINHNPNMRPSSSGLLRSGLIPVQTEDESIRAALRELDDPKSEFRGQLVSKIIANATSSQHSAGKMDAAALLRDYMYDLHDWTSPEVYESLLRKDVKDRLTAIFRRHGALEVERPILLPFSPHYSQHANPVFKLIDTHGTVLQMPLDLTLPYARILAKHKSPGPKTYTFGDVFRAVRSEGHPRTIGEVDFDIISYDSLDLALREAEAIKVLDEIVDEFPSMTAVQMCYHINHSLLLDAVLESCDIPPMKRPAVKEVISRLHTGGHTWATIRSELRNAPISVPATSIDELVVFDFRDTSDNAIKWMRPKFQSTANLEATFSHLQAVAIYLERFNVQRKVYINPLGSYNEKFYRGNILFQCVYDSKKKNVFAAGGRYDRLIKEHQLIQNPNMSQSAHGNGVHASNANIADCHAVGFNLSWQDLHRSMVRYHQGSIKGLSKFKKDQETSAAWSRIRRCDVLVDSFDKSLLRTTGLHVIQELWAQGVHAELALGDRMDSDHKASSAYTLGQDIMSYLYLIHVKQEGSVKVRNMAHNEEVEMRTLELASWFKNEMMHRERVEDHSRKLSRHHSHSEQSVASIDNVSNVQVMNVQTKGKKTNRRTIIEEALARCQEFMHGLVDGNVQVTAIETKDDIFERIRETRLGDADSWKKFIQHAPAGERSYLQDLHGLLKTQAAKAKAGYRSTFLYNFRTGSCIWYDLGQAPRFE
ncbi:MAG: hypothetical protein LQ352_000398 [Teloschistes flavicans]|nr:MAG: hypothetical protein LQ352_000398 [Teloschistes flavicans]